MAVVINSFTSNRRFVSGLAKPHGLYGLDLLLCVARASLRPVRLHMTGRCARPRSRALQARLLSGFSAIGFLSLGRGWSDGHGHGKLQQQTGGQCSTRLLTLTSRRTSKRTRVADSFAALGHVRRSVSATGKDVHRHLASVLREGQKSARSSVHDLSGDPV